jgi:CDP-L-myo-inositol myo-inositolphosphotransferase
VNVVLLAAGLGSRLGVLTRDLPKALISVGGKPLLYHALSFAERLQPSRIIVVGGFSFPLVKEALDSFRASAPADPPIQLVENTHFRDGNLVSLMTARPHLGEGFLVMNVDHIYRPSIASVVAAPVEQVTAFVDTDRKLGADDMKVERRPDGCVSAISKTLDKFDCGYVGMTRVPDALRVRYFEEAERALAEDGRAIHVERILARLAKTELAPTCRDISGHGWLEVDTPDERAAAEAALVAGCWV